MADSRGGPSPTAPPGHRRDGSAVDGQSGDGYSPEIFRLGRSGRRRYRTLLLVAGVLGVGATLPVVAANVDVHWVVVAVCIGVTSGLAVLSARPGRTEPLLTKFGPLAVAGVIFLLVMSTGGAASPYEILYVPLAGFAAAFEKRRTFLAVLAVSAPAALLPTVLDPDTDLLVLEVLIAGAVALTLVVVHRIASGLRDANRLYLSVLEGHAGPTYLLDSDGTFRWVNQPAQEVLGMHLEQIVGLPWPEVLAEGEAERLMPAFAAALAGDPQAITIRTDAPGGSYQLRGTAFPVNRYGRNVAVMGITHDVTELKSAAFGAGALRRTLDSLAIPVAIFDAATHAPLYANDAAEQLTTEPRAGTPAEVAWGRLQPPLIEELPEPGGTRHATVESVGEQGPRQLDVSIECLEGEQNLVVYTAVDASERDRRERELERAAELERATAVRLRELDRLKNAFLTAVSHELRTPATVILGVARSLQRLRGRQDADARGELEDALVRHADRLTQLLADLLDLGRLTEGTTRTDRESFDLVQVTMDLVERDPQRDLISVHAPATLPVHSDRVQVERIIENLLGNAAKYAAGTPVAISLTRRDDDGFRLTVSDQGPGIPEEDLERVFEPFYRIDLDHPQPGTGIGLALVAEFAAIHGGHARAERVAPGGGTRIIVDIPERRDITTDVGQETTPPS